MPSKPNMLRIEVGLSYVKYPLKNGKRARRSSPGSRLCKSLKLDH